MKNLNSIGGWSELEMKICFLRQPWTKIMYKIHEIKEHGFSMKWFTADFSKHKSTNVQVWVLDDRLSTFPSLSNCRDFLKICLFPKIIPKSKAVRQLVMQLLYSPFCDNYLISFPLWWTKIMLKYAKVYKYFFYAWRYNMICLVTSHDHLI